jgi:hypothetical protein
MDKFIEVKDAARQAAKHNEHRSSSVDARQTPRVGLNLFFLACRSFFQVRRRLVSSIWWIRSISTQSTQTRKCSS